MTASTRLAGVALVAALLSACSVPTTRAAAASPSVFRVSETTTTEPRAADPDAALFVPAGAPGSSAPRAQDDPPRDDWTFSAAPYLWAIGQQGDLNLRGNKADIDVEFDDILDNLDSAFLLMLGARKGDTVFRVDQDYLKISDDMVVGPARVDAEQATYIATIKAGQVFGEGAEAPIVFIGARYWNLDLDIEAFTAGTKVLDTDGNKHWWDPLIGFEKHVAFDGPWSLTLSGDVGGFGIGTSSEKTWQATVLALRETESGGALGVGWRHMSVDYSRGTGADRFEYDVRISGPLLGWLFRF